MALVARPIEDSELSDDGCGSRDSGACACAGLCILGCASASALCERTLDCSGGPREEYPTVRAELPSLSIRRPGFGARVRAQPAAWRLGGLVAEALFLSLHGEFGFLEICVIFSQRRCSCNFLLLFPPAPLPSPRRGCPVLVESFPGLPSASGVPRWCRCPPLPKFSMVFTFFRLLIHHVLVPARPFPHAAVAFPAAGVRRVRSLGGGGVAVWSAQFLFHYFGPCVASAGAIPLGLRPLLPFLGFGRSALAASLALRAALAFPGDVWLVARAGIHAAFHAHAGGAGT